jgi:hypothetical protein
VARCLDALLVVAHSEQVFGWCFEMPVDSHGIL